jgi:hypothetical protein
VLYGGKMAITTMLIIWNFLLSMAVVILIYLYLKKPIKLTQDNNLLDPTNRVVYLDSRHEENIKAKLEDNDEINP